MKRVRMIFTTTEEVQLAIKLMAAKNRTATGNVILEAVRQHYPTVLEEARKILRDRRTL